MRRLPVAFVLVFAIAAAMLAGCSSNSGKNSSGAAATTSVGSASTATTVATNLLHILVTNDDGVSAPGIDALVEALRKLPDTSVEVVAPAKNQSGAGSKTTPGTVTASDSQTASGYRAKAVNGYPADTIVYALDQHGVSERPELVVSGVNMGQNLGTLIDVSGTVGAALAAAQRGVPALAVSQGLALGAPKPDYPSGVQAALDWIAKHRDSLVPSTVTNLNIPTCPAGRPRPVVVVPVSRTATGIGKPDCVRSFPLPKSDVEAFLHGYITQTDNLSLKAS